MKSKKHELDLIDFFLINLLNRNLNEPQTMKRALLKKFETTTFMTHAMTHRDIKYERKLDTTLKK